jgi:ABC-type uncharacterized transport system permease subunit
MWFVYLVLLVLRRLRMVSGRSLAISLIAAFVFLLLTFWGTNLLSPLHHP